MKLTAENGIIFIHYLFALIAFATGAMAFFTGLDVVPDVQHIEAASDNEFRFFSVYWIAYGCFCFWVARDLKTRHGFIPAAKSQYLYEIYHSYCETHAGKNQLGGLASSQLRNYFMKNLGSPPRVGQAAQFIGISVSTLQRKLAMEGGNYGEVL
jgi:hypothetical protein